MICRELSWWNSARRFGCLGAGVAGAAILVSLSEVLAFLFEVEDQPAKELDSWRASSQV